MASVIHSVLVTTTTRGSCLTPDVRYINIMKYIYVVTIVVLSTLTAQHLSAEPPQPSGSTFGNIINIEYVEVDVLEVFEGTSKLGSKFKAYAAMWNDMKIIVSDSMNTSSFKKGDSMRIQVLEMSVGDDSYSTKQLTFHVDIENKAPNKPVDITP